MKNSIKKFCCIIPSTGRLSLNEECLPSVFNQTRKFDEVILVYDKNKEDFIEKNHQVSNILFTGGGKGGPYARSMAYSLSNSDYIVLLDDDDSIDPDFLYNIEKYINHAPAPPSLIISRVRKRWKEGFLPSVYSRPPMDRHSYNKDKYKDIKKYNWSPSTSSGLVLNKNIFHDYPANSKIKGFNDIQVWRSCRSKFQSIYYCHEAVCIFNQYFSNDRLTSNLDDRIFNLSIAEKNGISFSEIERNSILLSATLSSLRSSSYKRNLKLSNNALKESLKLYKLSPNGGIKLLLNFAISIWLFICPRRKNKC